MLTVKQIDAAKPAEKSYRLADAGGLFLFVPPSGKKVWRMRYRFGGKEKTLVIGPYRFILSSLSILQTSNDPSHGLSDASTTSKAPLRMPSR